MILRCGAKKRAASPATHQQKRCRERGGQRGRLRDRNGTGGGGGDRRRNGKWIALRGEVEVNRAIVVGRDKAVVVEVAVHPAARVRHADVEVDGGVIVG